jgi:hypothetical protein
METPNEYGQRCLNKLHAQILSGAINPATQVEIIELLCAHLHLLTTQRYADRKGISYNGAKKHRHDLEIDGIKYYATNK